MADLRFEELGRVREFALPELQARADNNLLAPGRRQFRVWLGDREAAYLSFDIWDDELNLYEVFVANAMRGQGIGSEILSLSITFAKQLKKSRLTVCPHPLSDQRPEDLVEWYMRRGFRPTEDPRRFEIILSHSAEAS